VDYSCYHLLQQASSSTVAYVHTFAGHMVPTDNGDMALSMLNIILAQGAQHKPQTATQ